MHTYHTLLEMLKQQYTLQEARAIALFVFEKGFGVQAIDVYANKVRHFSAQEEILLEKIYQQLANGVPVQYAVGTVPFGDRDYNISQGALIPRPETEGLVTLAVDRVLESSLANTKLLDVGTGSGCIACSMALALPHNRIEAWDISPQALLVAKSNVDLFGVNVKLYQRDLFVTIKEPLKPTWGAIISNPPYVRMSEQQQMEPHVYNYEPHQALFVSDDDALCYYKALGRLALGTLLPDGFLAVEINRYLANETVEIFQLIGLHEVTIHKDIFGADRYILCSL